jgi:hypothetical protein
MLRRVFRPRLILLFLIHISLTTLAFSAISRTEEAYHLCQPTPVPTLGAIRVFKNF